MLELLRKLENNGGLTLRNGVAISYKAGYQVADYGVEAATAEEAAKAVETMKGNCGIWLSEGIYYIDHSMHIKTLRDALRIGREHAQQTILRWRDMELISCK